MKSENENYFAYIFKVYPKSKIVDYVKFLYQVYIGPSHFKDDEEGIIKTLEKEKFNLRPEHTDSFIEPIGNEFGRVYLSKILEKGYSIYTFVRLYLLSKILSKADLESYKKSLDDFGEFIQLKITKLDYDEYSKFIKTYAKHGYLPLRHSDKYKSEYNPHYLLLSNKVILLLPVYLKIDLLIRDNGDYLDYINNLNPQDKEFIIKYWEAIYKDRKL